MPLINSLFRWSEGSGRSDYLAKVTYCPGQERSALDPCPNTVQQESSPSPRRMWESLRKGNGIWCSPHNHYLKQQRTLEIVIRKTQCFNLLFFFLYLSMKWVLSELRKLEHLLSVGLGKQLASQRKSWVIAKWFRQSSRWGEYQWVQIQAGKGISRLNRKMQSQSRSLFTIQ